MGMETAHDFMTQNLGGTGNLACVVSRELEVAGATRDVPCANECQVHLRVDEETADFRPVMRDATGFPQQGTILPSVKENHFFCLAER